MPESIPSNDVINSQQDTISEIRLSVAKLCQDYPGDYWREIDRNQE